MKKQEPVELEMPDGISAAEQAVELLRAWIADGALMVSLNSDAFGGRTGDWGRLLAEVGHHVAKAAELNGHMSYEEAITALGRGFTQNLNTDQVAMSGKIRGRKNH